MENLCNNCIECCHKDVCAKYKATGGVRKCSNFMEMPKKGKWIEFNTFMTCSECDKDWYYGDNDCDCFDFCPNCGADMRGTEDGEA